MSLDINRLENIKNKVEGVVARCPACAEVGCDKKGEHLFVHISGRFGCVLFPGDSGKEHRKRIFALVGENSKYVAVKFKERKKIKVIKYDILGHMGQD